MTSAVLSADIQAAIATLVDADKQDPGAVGKMWDKMSVGWIDYFGEVGTWQTPTLINSWVNYGGVFQTARYRKIGFDVEIQGTIKSGTLNSTGFILPIGYRPESRMIFNSISGNLLGRFDIYSSGEVVIAVSSVGSNTDFSINCNFGI